MQRANRNRRTTSVLAATLGGFVTSAQAADISWINPSGGTFHEPMNWSGGVVPGVDDRAIFESANSGYMILFQSDVTNQNLLIPRGDILFELDGTTYELAGTEPGTGHLEIGTAPGNFETGHLALQNGTLSSRSALLGSMNLSWGIVLVKPNATWSVSELLQLGLAQVLVQNGAKLNVGHGQASRTTLALEVGSATYPGGGNLLLEGSGSKLTNHATTVIGADHLGFVRVDNGAQMTDFAARVADGTGVGSISAIANVFVSGTGAIWTTETNRIIGTSTGLAEVFVEAGGLMRSLGVGGAPDFIDAPPLTSVPQVTVTGPGSRYVLDSGVVIGVSGPASVEVLQGGELSAGFIELGEETGSSGLLDVHGAGSRVSVGSLLTVGSDPQSQKLGTGVLQISSAARVSNAGTTVIHETGEVQFDSGSFTSASLDVRGGRMLLAPGADKVVRTNATDISGSSKIDLADNAMAIDYIDSGASPIASVRSWIASAYNGGAWDGAGLTSSMASATHGLGYAEASALPSIPPLFGDVDGDAVLITFARFGDADLSGDVNLVDFDRLAANFGATDAFWYQGDFNYDGIVNLQDFNRLAANFGLAAAPEGPTPQDWVNLASAVPEPRSCITTGVTALAAMSLRRRKNCWSHSPSFAL